jgi:hypothetical protein
MRRYLNGPGLVSQGKLWSPDPLRVWWWLERTGRLGDVCLLLVRPSTGPTLRSTPRPKNSRVVATCSAPSQAASVCKPRMFDSPASCWSRSVVCCSLDPSSIDPVSSRMRRFLCDGWDTSFVPSSRESRSLTLSSWSYSSWTFVATSPRLGGLKSMFRSAAVRPVTHTSLDCHCDSNRHRCGTRRF